MRIVGGRLKGRTLYGFCGNDIRPTSDNARESLFNILGDLSGADFLDLFSGTGAVGIEALSRGANVVFNDYNRESVRLIKENLKKVGENGEVNLSDALAFIKSVRQKFDVVFLDPPYKSEIIPDLLNSVSDVLKDDGTVVFENENVFTGAAKGLVLTDVRKYGRAMLHFFAKQQAGAAVYAGTFDPITAGHFNSVLSAIESFGKVYIVVGKNSGKTPFFSEEERVLMVKAAFRGINAEIVKYSDFASESEYAEYLKRNNVRYYVRGIRNEKDFSYEKKAEKRNAEIYPFIKTAYIFCESEYKDVSSTKVKKFLEKGKLVSEFIPVSARETFDAIITKKQPKE